MRGRKPLPLAVQLQRNNPGGRPLNFHAPKHATLDPTVPPELTTDQARAEWERLVETLSHGHVTIVDRATLIGYCLKYGQWQLLEAEAGKHPFIVKAPSGYPIPNPALGMANTAYKLMLKAAAELGITPSSRTRIVVQPKPEEAHDDFSKYQRRRLTLAKGNRGAPASRR